MHIYVNNEEANVKITSGSQNPTDSIERGTEFYIGHDSLSTIDEVSISTTAITPNTQTDGWETQWWFWTALGAGLAALTSAIFLVKTNKGKQITT